MKVANDVRWYASGPRNGLGELRIPENEPGSSIMPGKVNPTQAEALTMVATRVFGNDATVAFAGSQGSFELNTFLPVMARNLLESIALIANVSRLFARRCIDGIEADVDRCRAYAESSPSLGTALNPHLGYEKAAQLVKESVRSGRSINSPSLRSVIVDFDLSLFSDAMPESQVTTSVGTIVHAYLKPLVDQGVLRLAFEFEPGDATLADLQAVLTSPEGVAQSETWLARWTA